MPATLVPLTSEQEHFLLTASRRYGLTRSEVLDAGFNARMDACSWPEACRRAQIVKRSRLEYAALRRRYEQVRAACAETHGDVAAPFCAPHCLRTHPHPCTCDLRTPEFWAMMSWRSPECSHCGGFEVCLPTCEASDAIRREG